MPHHLDEHAQSKKLNRQMDLPSVSQILLLSDAELLLLIKLQLLPLQALKVFET